MSEFYDPEAEIRKTYHRMPRWDQGAKWYELTWRMGDSLPQSFLSRYRERQAKWLHKHPKPWSEAEQEEYRNRFAALIEPELDKGYGSCLLRKREIREYVVNTLRHHNETYYDLESFVIMPNHVHVCLKLREGAILWKVIKSIKGFSAYSINQALQRKGPFWQDGCYDRLIRSERHFWFVKNYIRKNPANLHEGEFTLWERHAESNAPNK